MSAPARSIADVLADARLDPLERRMLLCAAAGLRREDLARAPEMALDEAALGRYDAFVSRRLAGEPIAYLVGSREFYGRSFATDARVLIPRPETELLAELALLRCPQHATGRSLLDIGTGSGCLAITLKLERPDCDVVGIDISSDALAVARANGVAHCADVTWVKADLALPSPGAFDVIVANPPYIAALDDHLGQGDLRFEPAIALVGGMKGTELIDTLVGSATGSLKPDGWLLIEHGHTQALEVRARLLAAGLADVQSWTDLAGTERVSGGRRRSAKAL